jgi:cyclic pyranopterin phosphate synthase
MPNEGVPLAPHNQILSYEEINTVAIAAAEVGISKIRITGGEPLIRLGIVDLVKMLSQIKGIDDIALTTNAIHLEQYATQLKEAGLKRVNISLDTLQNEKFEKITRVGTLKKALAGIRAAHKAKLEPVKINVVVMRGRTSLKSLQTEAGMCDLLSLCRLRTTSRQISGSCHAQK